jgi:hypothetical protein
MRALQTQRRPDRKRESADMALAVKALRNRELNGEWQEKTRRALKYLVRWEDTNLVSAARKLSPNKHRRSIRSSQFMFEFLLSNPPLIRSAGAGGPGSTGTLPCLTVRSVLKPIACRTILPFRAAPKVPAF